MSPSPRILVTGATGFVGAQVVSWLGSGDWEVHGARRGTTFTTEDLSSPVTWHTVDLRDPENAESLIERVRPTHVLHLAWNAEHGAYWTAVDNDAWADATIALAEAFAAYGGERFVAAGTCAEYDWTNLSEPVGKKRHRSRRGPCTDKPSGAPASACLSVRADAGFSAAWGRLFFPYGPGEDPRRLIPSVAHALRTGARARVTTGTQIRDFVHVADAARAFTALLTHELTGAVNIGSGTPVTIRTVVETLARAAGRPDAVDFGVVPTHAGEPPMIVADVSRMFSTGWRPQVALEIGLSALVRQ